MTVGEKIAAILVFLLAAALLVLGVRSFREKGFLLNNAYLYASKQERETMDRKPYYRQSAIVFWLLSAVFCVIGLSTVLRNSRILLLELPFAAGAIIYAVVSSVRIAGQGTKEAASPRTPERKEEEREDPLCH